MIPALAGLGSVFWGCILAIVVFIILFAISYLLLKLKGLRKALPYSITGSGVVALLVFCISTSIILDQAFEGPPYPDNMPTVQDVVGTYLLSQGSIRELADSGYLQTPAPDNCSISLFENRTFIGTNLPDMMWLYGSNELEFHSVSGSWELYRTGIWLNTTEIDGIAVNERIGLNFYGEEPPFDIYFLISELHWLVFVKPSATQ
jgi:hypothetical protein